MTAATLTHLPLAAGGAVLASTGRVALWALSRFMRAPLANSAIFSMVTLTALAASNALYFQTEKHPAPLFGPNGQQASAPAPVRVDPVIPAVRQSRPVLAPLPAETTGSIATEPTPIGNTDVFELQRKLQSLQLFEGTIDGYYGPQTAGAIRRFEELNGLQPTGELTPAILEAVRSAPALTAIRALEVLETTDTVAAVPRTPLALAPTDRAALQPVQAPGTAVLPPLPAPAPLPAAVQPRPSAPLTTPMGRELPETPEEAFTLAVDTAGDAIDTIIDGVQSVTMTRPPKAAPVRQAPPAPAAGIGASVPAPAAVQTAMVAPVAVPGKPLVVAEPESTVTAEVPVLDTDARPEDLMPTFSVTDPVIVAQVQRGLGSLGFLHGPADGVAGEATAKAIRNFEVYYNYQVTGRISPELLDLLVRNGASI